MPSVRWADRIPLILLLPRVNTTSLTSSAFLHAGVAGFLAQTAHQQTVGSMNSRSRLSASISMYWMIWGCHQRGNRSSLLQIRFYARPTAWIRHHHQLSASTGQKKFLRRHPKYCGERRRVLDHERLPYKSVIRGWFQRFHYIIDH